MEKLAYCQLGKSRASDGYLFSKNSLLTFGETRLFLKIKKPRTV
jgi:hypothetical protein